MNVFVQIHGPKIVRREAFVSFACSMADRDRSNWAAKSQYCTATLKPRVQIAAQVMKTSRLPDAFISRVRSEHLDVICTEGCNLCRTMINTYAKSIIFGELILPTHDRTENKFQQNLSNPCPERAR
jgi:hypothetical protein